MRRSLTLLAALTMLAALAVPAWAITRGGVPDDGEHPMVALSVYFDAGGAPLWRCSGTMVSPTIYLTAGHCTTAPAASAVLFFEENVDEVASYPFGDRGSPRGAVHTHPAYVDAQFYLHDLGVVELTRPVSLDTYGQLPEVGLLDQFSRSNKRNGVLTAVGYGLQQVAPAVVAERIRLQADLDIVDLTGTGGIPSGTTVITEGNAASGGTCSGDSGGPQFLEGTTIVAAVTSFGYNAICGGVGGAYRVDQPDDLAWLHDTFGDALAGTSAKGPKGKGGGPKG